MNEKPMNRAERRKLETRQRLLTSAAKLLMQVNYDDLTVRAITDDADVGYGTFYLHFRDKDEIVWEIIAAIIKQTDEIFKSHTESLDSPVREFVAMRMLFEFIQSNKARFMIVLGRNSSPVLSARYRDAVTALNLDNLKQNRYQPSQIGISNEFAANFITGAALQLAIWWIETDAAFTPHEMATMFFKLIYQMEPPQIDE